MKKTWLLLADRFDALQPRERVILFVGFLAIVLGAFYVLVFDSASLRYQRASKSLEQNDKMLVALRQQALTLTQLTGAAPDVEAQKRIADLRASNAALRERLSGANVPLVSPDKMRAVLQDLIAAQKALQLVSMRSLPTEDLLADTSGNQSAPAAGGPSLYRQGLELTVQGTYRDLAEYLRHVEALPWKVQIDTVSLQTETYPLSRLKIVLRTLSLERSWIGL